MPEPYTRHEEFRSALGGISGLARAHQCSSGPPFTPFIGSGNLATLSGSPATQTTDPCFVNEDGTPQAYVKLDPGDVCSCTGGGSNNETLCGGWIRIDSLPGADAEIMRAITNTGGVNFDGIGIDPSGQFFVANAGVKQGTDAVVRNLGEWYFVLKMNDSGGGGTGTWFYVNGVRVLSLGGAGGVKNSPGRIGSAGFDGAVAYYFNGSGTTALTDASVLAAYRRGVTKLYQRAVLL